jgi:hypothetical protein
MTILNTNFNPDNIADHDFHALYHQRRRDAVFAYVWREGDTTFALRDHLGNVPLFYRRDDDKLQFATDLNSLIRPTDTLNQDGIRHYIGLRTVKIVSLINEISIVPPATVMAFTPTNTTIRYQYRLQPRPDIARWSFDTLVDETERLFIQALKRVLRHTQVGLYLSGGIDSALIGLYLRQLGADINAYTSAPWGEASSEIAFAKINAETIPVREHHIDVLTSENYDHALNAMGRLYGSPQGSATGIGVASMWLNTPMSQEKQIFLGQNSDTLTCSVAPQYLTYFLRWLPRMVRKRLRMPHPHVVQNYLHFATQGLVNQNPFETLIPNNLSPLAQLTLAGMLVMHTPSDGEVLTLPGLRQHIIMSNPYFDIDLIEFYLGVALHQRVKFKASSRPLALEKRLFQALAQRRLPKELVARKKAFVVSMERDQTTRDLSQHFPQGDYYGVALRNSDARTSAEILRRWLHETGLA